MMIYTPQSKMADLMREQPHILLLITHFGVPFGVGEDTIEQVCRDRQIDTTTFLAVIHFLLSDKITDLSHIHIPTLQTYLHNAHEYYLHYRLPYLRHLLIEALPPENDHQVVMLMLRFYDTFVQLIKRHIQQENAGAVKGHEKEGQHIAGKLSELINLMITFYPLEYSGDYTASVVNALENLQRTKEEILAHCEIEDKIFVPAMLLQHTQDTPGADDALSEREKDVLIEVVKGLSNKQIADRLCLSVHTVVTHRKNIVRKLNIHSVAGLTIYAVMHHLVQIPALKTV